MAKNENAEVAEPTEQLTGTESFVDRYKLILVYGSIGIIVLLIGFVGYKKFIKEPKDLESQDVYWNAFYDWQNNDTTGLAKVGTDNYLGFEDISSQYAGSPGGNIATYALATMAMEDKDFDGALAYLEDCEFEDVMLGTLVIGMKGDCNVELGEYETALTFFNEAAERETNDFTSPMYLKKAGLVYEKLGQPEKAVEAYQKIKDEFYKSSEASDIDKYIIRAQN